MNSPYLSQNTLDLFELFSMEKISTLATRKSYMTELNLFVNAIKKDAVLATNQDAKDYLDTLFQRVHNKDIVYETLAKKYKYLNAMYNYWHFEVEPNKLPNDFTNPFYSNPIQEPTYTYNESDIKSFEEVNTFFDHVLESSKRDYVLFQLIYFSLVKPSIILNLKRQNVKMKDDDYYLVLIGIKSTPNRNIKIPKGIGAGIGYLLNSHTDEYIFLNSRGKRLTLRTLQRHMSSYSDSLGLGADAITPTSLYHAGIFHALKGGMDKATLMEQLGITDIRFLDRYQIAEAANIIPIESSCDYIKIKNFN